MRQITVLTTYDCTMQDDSVGLYVDNPSWRHNMIGCGVIEILREIYNFNITYVFKAAQHKNNGTNIDLYAEPTMLQPGLLEIANPVHTVFFWRFGFILRRVHDFSTMSLYYSKPFTGRVWDCLTGVAFMVTMLFFLMTWWEKRLLGSAIECSLGLEMLYIIGGYCQHVFPVETIFFSRRTAHLTFFLYAYIIYNVYTSNLLSHLVNDREHNIHLLELESKNYKYVTFEGMKNILINEYGNQHEIVNDKGRLDRVRVTSVSEALEAVRTTKTAFLTDYTSVYRLIKKRFSDSEICELVEINLRSDTRKYIFASKTFRYMEELRIGTLRAREAGVFQRFLSFETYMPVTCSAVLHQEVRFAQIITPLFILLSASVISVMILILERIYYERNRLWPYIE